MDWMRMVEHAACRTAAGAFSLWQHAVRLLPEPAPFHPQWTDTPVPRGRARSKPPLGWPRETDSLCPTCVKDVRAAIVGGEVDWRHLVEGKPGEIRARIEERDGRIVMRKRCPEHGEFEDVISVDPAFLTRIERLFPGRDVALSPDALHDHGTSAMRYGRGSVLTVDLTNRCNMMCDPCFMDANQVGYVHELEWAEIRRILDDAASVRPRRQLSIQFSGGEPTLSPHFLPAIRYAREKGYFAVQAATNGLRFAEEPGFARACKEAGLRMAYLQFDGVTNAAHAGRKIGNLYDVKRRAIDELHAAGIDVILVVTVVNGVNSDQVGPIVQFAIDNADKITVVSFQPVSFTGRDEDVSDERRAAQRYTLSHLAHDVARQTGYTEPLRDWFPLSALSPFGDVVDAIDGPARDFGQLKCGCHPNCGIGTALFVNKRTRQVVPLVELIDLERLLADLRALFDAHRDPRLTKAALVAAFLRNYRPDKAPPGLHLGTLLRQYLSQTGVAHAPEDDAKSFEWRVLFVAGMWFQDLWNYDFRRTEMCIIPYGTELGEISFCAYNTGVGWRAVVEKMKSTATLAEWYRRHGKHPVHADGRPLQLPPATVPEAVREHPQAVAERLAATASGLPQPRAARPRRRTKHLPIVA
ncbi:MAG: radical SAM protein [Myxococcales bacterium]|nr:radical SAM protein [Myxococcales bacterium]